MKLKKLVTSTVLSSIILTSLGGSQLAFADTPEDNIGKTYTLDSSSQDQKIYINKMVPSGLSRASYKLEYIGTIGTTYVIAGISGKEYRARINTDYVGYNYIAKGDAVFVAQAWLYAKGYSISLDGIFGENTRRAVASFQSSRGLSVDSVIGPQTWKALSNL